MTRIDRYILFLYARVFVICFLTLSGLLIVVQVFTNMDEFLAHGKARGSLVLALAEYFSPYLLTIYDRMCGLLALLATMFVVAWLYRTNEMTALLAAGISKARIVRPILLLSVIVIATAAISRELVIPHFANVLSKSPQDLVGERTQPIRPTEDAEMGLLIAGRHLVPKASVIAQPVFKFYGPAIHVTRQITGFEAKYEAANENHPSGYLISAVIASDSLIGKSSVKVNDQWYLMLPTDNPWLTPEQCFVPSRIEFDMLRGGTAKQFASTPDLIWRLKNQSQYYGADLSVLVHSRCVQPLLDITQLLIGLPMILSSRSRNLVGMVVSSVLTFGIFFGVSAGMQSLGAGGTLFTPAAAAWGPLLVFGPIGYAKARQALWS